MSRIWLFIAKAPPICVQVTALCESMSKAKKIRNDIKVLSCISSRNNKDLDFGSKKNL